MTVMDVAPTPNASTVDRYSRDTAGVSTTVAPSLASEAAVGITWVQHQGRRPQLALRFPVGLLAPTVQTYVSATVDNLNRMLLTRVTGAGRYEAERVQRALPLLLQLAKRFRNAPRFFPLEDGGLLAKFDLPVGALEVEVDSDDDILVLMETEEGAVSRYDYEAHQDLDRLAARLV